MNPLHRVYSFVVRAGVHKPGKLWGASELIKPLSGEVIGKFYAVFEKLVKYDELRIVSMSIWMWPRSSTASRRVPCGSRAVHV